MKDPHYVTLYSGQPDGPHTVPFTQYIAYLESTTIPHHLWISAEFTTIIHRYTGPGEPKVSKTSTKTKTTVAETQTVTAEGDAATETQTVTVGYASWSWKA